MKLVFFFLSFLFLSSSLFLKNAPVLNEKSIWIILFLQSIPSRSFVEDQNGAQRDLYSNRLLPNEYGRIFVRDSITSLPPGKDYDDRTRWQLDRVKHKREKRKMDRWWKWRASGVGWRKKITFSKEERRRKTTAHCSLVWLQDEILNTLLKHMTSGVV